MSSGHKYFGLESGAVDERSLDLRTRIARCLKPDIERCGHPPEVMEDAIERELTRRFARGAFEDLAWHGIDVAGKRLVDLGSGMGAAAVEGAMRGAYAFAVEPGRGLRDVAHTRLREVGRGGALAGNAEGLPFRDASVDVVVSMQVLEHVVHPIEMLKEAFRILKPGGHFFLTCENYLSFQEPHYRVAWLPLLPKWIGARYLRLRGRSPEFLYNSITYVTRPGVIRMLRECGFVLVRKERLDALMEDPGRVQSAWKRSAIAAARRLMSARFLSGAAFTAQEARKLFAVGFIELVRKPG